MEAVPGKHRHRFAEGLVDARFSAPQIRVGWAAYLIEMACNVGMTAVLRLKNTCHLVTGLDAPMYEVEAGLL